jgi:hypothetical protein
MDLIFFDMTYAMLLSESCHRQNHVSPAIPKIRRFGAFLLAFVCTCCGKDQPQRPVLPLGKVSFALNENIVRHDEHQYCANPSSFVESPASRISRLEPNPGSLVESHGWVKAIEREIDLTSCAMLENDRSFWIFHPWSRAAAMGPEN